MRVFVTGAAGRLGRALVRKLVSSGAEVVGLASDQARAEAVNALGATPLVGRLEDEAVLTEGVRGSNIVYHLAGGVRGAGQDTAERINLQGTRHLRAAIQASTFWKREVSALVFTSSVSVYGDRAGLWVSEEMAPYPQTAYAHSKVAAEAVLLRAAREEGFPTRVVRLGAVYGPEFGFTMADRIRDGRCWLPGEGRNYVPAIHVDDAVAGLIRVAEAGLSGNVYNLADPNPVTLSEFYAEVHRRVGGKPARFWSTWIPSYVQHWAASRSEALQAALGRRPRVTPDTLRLYTASVRMKVERMEKELGFTWSYPTHAAGLAATFGDAASTGVLGNP